ncbi:MAG: hypothetical protein ABI430_02115 [Candidatus Taylorbacteria bacterium]
METQSYSQSEVPELSLEAFQQEIAKMKEEEEKGKKTGKPSHFANGPEGEEMKASELTSADLAMWQRIKEFPKQGIITQDDFKTYSEEAMKDGNFSRGRFVGFLANQVQKIWFE